MGLGDRLQPWQQKLVNKLSKLSPSDVMSVNRKVLTFIKNRGTMPDILTGAPATINQKMWSDLLAEAKARRRVNRGGKERF